MNLHLKTLFEPLPKIWNLIFEIAVINSSIKIENKKNVYDKSSKLYIIKLIKKVLFMVTEKVTD